MLEPQQTISIVGAGLAGSEAALQLAEMGHRVQLFEMRPKKMTPAHKTGSYAELVCSNSFGSVAHHAAPGQLKWEAEKLGSQVLQAAGIHRVPAGQALGIDREKFSEHLTQQLKQNPNIEIQEEEITNLDDLPRPAIIATGPLTSEPLAQSLLEHFGDRFLYFFDAIAPIIEADSINMDVAWIGDRYGKGTGDYINCPLNKEQYENLIEEIKNADTVEAKDFEKDTPFFEGCMPIEEMVCRGDQTPRFGPLSPKGLTHPVSGEKFYAIVQLRKENRAGTSYNMVGFQTKMKYPEQKRIFSMIPGLEEAHFLKLGSIHRNMFINSTKKLNSNLSSQNDPSLFFAGQITGVEGYFESTCIGMMVARFVDDFVNHNTKLPPPRETALGSLLYALTGEIKDDFQPTNINFGLFPPLDLPKKVGKRQKRDLVVERARQSFQSWILENPAHLESKKFIEKMAEDLKSI
ncbi:MAG: methylenetetrahydrofolate--tRNA-(uracil(54)-C(5))-methyltransferase (FADH(2)-oxidizing) TrmFO [Bdellovibrionales bacterium]|nr:methylenetetrahydrofolate--tRNA-(uracil(54)-C(5))-methyltransferase (FADH(2)-oxidizing) TrmFO [Bdellovibrionales bacterium]